MAKPIVAVVGRPNVGKSTLFNKLIGQRLAIVEDTPHFTRDRIYGLASGTKQGVLLVDTGGIKPSIDDGILLHMRTNRHSLLFDTAQVIIFVTDLRSGVTAPGSGRSLQCL